MKPIYWVGEVKHPKYYKATAAAAVADTATQLPRNLLSAPDVICNLEKTEKSSL